MQITLIRKPRHPWGTEGELRIADKLVCHTVEHPDRCMRAGAYEIYKDSHPFRHGDGALASLHGEIIVGERLMTGVVTHSAQHHQRLMDRLRKAWKRNETILLTIQTLPPSSEKLHYPDTDVPPTR